MAATERGSDQEQIYKDWCKFLTQRRCVIHHYNINGMYDILSEDIVYIIYCYFASAYHVLHNNHNVVMTAPSLVHCENITSATEALSVEYVY